MVPPTPQILYEICSGILRYMREEGVSDMNFLDAKDARFHDFRKTLDTCMKEVASQGIGVSVKQADPLTPEQENVLWKRHKHSNCKHFGLRGPDKHRKLKVCQLRCDVSDGKTCIGFCGRTSKNFAGGPHQRNILAKSIRHFSESGTPLYIYIYMHLTSLWWNKVHSIDGHFVEPKSGPEIRFGIQPRGVNKFGIIIKTMCAEAGFVWELLKPLGETNLFQSVKLRD